MFPPKTESRAHDAGLPLLDVHAAASSSKGRLHCNISNSGGVLLVTFPSKKTRSFAIPTCCFIKICRIHIAKEQQLTKRLAGYFKKHLKKLTRIPFNPAPPKTIFHLPIFFCFATCGRLAQNHQRSSFRNLIEDGGSAGAAALQDVGSYGHCLRSIEQQKPRGF